MAYEGWALVEQMGFRQTVGKVSEVEVYGTKMLRLDVPVFGSIKSNDAPQVYVTRFCGGPSLYQVSPLDEETGIDMARRQADPRPVKPTSYQIEDQREDEDEPCPIRALGNASGLAENTLEILSGAELGRGFNGEQNERPDDRRRAALGYQARAHRG